MSLTRWLALVMLACLLLALKLAHDTLRAPIVQQLSLQIGPSKEAGTSDDVRVALLADIHVAGPDMPPSRLQRIVEQTNALQPDLVLIAGDLVSDKRTATHHYETRDAIAPLANLRAPLGVVAVPGNHDHWRDMPAIAGELAKYDIALLQNEILERGGLVIVGLDDDFTGRADLDRALAEAVEFDQPLIVLSHSPDPFAQMPEKTGLVLAGHTHCGQIAWPWGGSPASMSDFGSKYACGVVRERGNTLITSAGIGTSVLPFRLFTQPEIWIVHLTPSS